MDVKKLLEERSKTHGDHKQVYSLVWRLWEETINTIAFKQLPAHTKVELLMVLFKTGRAVHNPTVKDHFDDIGGYAQLACGINPAENSVGSITMDEATSEFMCGLCNNVFSIPGEDLPFFSDGKMICDQCNHE